MLNRYYFTHDLAYWVTVDIIAMNDSNNAKKKNNLPGLSFSTCGACLPVSIGEEEKLKNFPVVDNDNALKSTNWALLVTALTCVS